MLKARYHDERIIFLGNVVILFLYHVKLLWSLKTRNFACGGGGTTFLPEYLILPRKSIMFAHCILVAHGGGGGSGEEENYVFEVIEYIHGGGGGMGGSRRWGKSNVLDTKGECVGGGIPLARWDFWEIWVLNSGFCAL